MKSSQASMFLLNVFFISDIFSVLVCRGLLAHAQAGALQPCEALNKGGEDEGLPDQGRVSRTLFRRVLLLQSRSV
jgi:hypothetical protein